MADLKIDITLASSKPFPQVQPLRVSYIMSFNMTCDYLTYEAAFYEYWNFLPNEVYTITITPRAGNPFTFTGILHNVDVLSEARHQRLHFMSKHYLDLEQMTPLFGKGKTSDIIKSFYAKMGLTVSSATIDDSTLSSSFCFPRNYDVRQAITYLIQRSVTKDNGLMRTTVIGETGYVRSNLNGKQDLDGIFYTVSSIQDKRKEIDIDGGLTITLIGDSAKQNKIDLNMPGTSETLQNEFYSYTDTTMNKALAQHYQLEKFYSNYTAVVGTPGCLPMVGSNFIIGSKDLNNGQVTGNQNFERILNGKYFIHTQEVIVDFTKSYETSILGMELVKAS